MGIKFRRQKQPNTRYSPTPQAHMEKTHRSREKIGAVGGQKAVLTPGQRTKMDRNSKALIVKSVISPVCTYGICLRESEVDSDIEDQSAFMFSRWYRTPRSSSQMVKKRNSQRATLLKLKLPEYSKLRRHNNLLASWRGPFPPETDK